MKSPLVNSLYRPNLKYVFKGINPPPNGWLYSKEKMEEFFNNGEILIPEDKNARLYRKIYLDTYKGQVIQNIWTDIPIVNPMAKEQTEFSTQKPEKLLERIIKTTTQEGDIVLDFCLGSGTTVAVSHKLKRQYIGVEQMQYIENITIERLKKVIEGDTSGISKSVNWQGGGEFVYCELANDAENFRNEVRNAKANELPALLAKAKQSSFLSYRVNKEQFNDFETLNEDEQRTLLLQLVDANMLYINYSDLENKDFDISEEDKKLNKQFYKEI